MAIRPSTPADLDLHIKHRLGMFHDMAMGDEAGMARMAGRFRAWLLPRLVSGEVRGLVLEEGGVAVASTLMWFREHLPVPVSELDVRGQIFNVFVEPGCRGRGLARQLMEHLEMQAKNWGLEVLELHASKDAERLYTALGFEPTSEMRKVISTHVAVPHQWRQRR